MPRASAQNPSSKFARYRAAKKRQGLKLLRIWVPDINAPGFAEEVARQAAIINAAPDSAELMDFIDAATADVLGAPYDWGADGPPPWPHKPTVKVSS